MDEEKKKEQSKTVPTVLKYGLNHVTTLIECNFFFKFSKMFLFRKKS